jgi:hypothetical protein
MRPDTVVLPEPDIDSDLSLSGRVEPFSVELAAPYRQLGRTLARRAFARSGIAPLTRPIGAKAPRDTF